MKPERIRAVQAKQPFRPFKIRLSDGSSHEIHQPELIWVTDDLIGISLPVNDPERGTITKAVLCDPEHIVATEFLPRAKSKAA